MKALIVVDYQNDFVSGSLGFETAPSLDEIIVKKIEEYRENDDEVIFTYDTHEENYLETLEGKNLPIAHCISDTEGWELYGETKTKQRATDQIFRKETFGSSQLFDYLRDNEYDSVELVGLVSNICVISNAVLAKTALPNTEIIVDAAATDSFDKILNEKVLDVMEGLQIKVINRKKN